jgi:hypothetical protein
MVPVIDATAGGVERFAISQSSGDYKESQGAVPAKLAA